MASPKGRTSEPAGRANKRRLALATLGAYYIATGAWPLIHFHSFARLISVPVHPFQAHTFGAVLIVIGACLVEAARRDVPGSFPTLVAVGMASAIAFTELVWLPQLRLLTALWLDLAVQLSAIASLLLLFPKTSGMTGRARRRR